MRFFFSAGEASGDAYAADLIQGIRTEISGEELEFFAIGGRRSRDAGAQLIDDSSRWGAVGILEAIKVGPRVWRGLIRAKQALRRLRPGVFVPIDYGFINVKLAGFAKSLGWKVLYFIPPGSWRRDRQGGDLPRVTDAIVTPFPWSADLLAAAGANAHYFGHPLVEMTAGRAQPDRERAGIAVLPGSRQHEIESNLPAIAAATEGMDRVRFGLAANVDRVWIEGLWRRLSSVTAEFDQPTYDVLAGSRAAIVCSGTATLEAALLDCPSVVVYRGSKMMEIEFKIRKPKFDFISLPNILLNRRLLPELLQHDASPAGIRRELENILAGPGREAQLSGFRELRDQLGPSNVNQQTVGMLVQMARSL